jgi:hypothetical protein
LRNASRIHEVRPDSSDEFGDHADVSKAGHRSRRAARVGVVTSLPTAAERPQIRIACGLRFLTKGPTAVAAHALAEIPPLARKIGRGLEIADR